MAIRVVAAAFHIARGQYHPVERSHNTAAAQKTFQKVTSIFVSPQQARGLANTILGTDDVAFIADMANLIHFFEKLRQDDPLASRGCGVGVGGWGVVAVVVLSFSHARAI